MEKDVVLRQFLDFPSHGVSSLEEVLVSLKDHFPPLRDDVLPKSTAAEIDDLISDLHRMITAIKIRRNTLAPIQRLPDDVMIQILRYWCFDTTTRYSREEFTSNDELVFTLRWTKLMTVCRRWYNLLLHDGLVWSYISTERLRTYNHIPAQVKRSKDTLLALRHRELDDTKAYDTNILPLERIAARVRRLELLSLPSDNIQKILGKFEPHDLPELEFLSISTKNRDASVASPTLGDGFLALPKLRRLYLTDVILFVTSLPSQLTELRLGSIRKVFEPQVDLPVFFNTLKELSVLQILEIRGFLRWAADQRYRWHDTLALPDLRKLILQNQRHILSPFLEWVNMPPDIPLHLTDASPTTNAREISRTIFSHVRPHFRQISAKPIQTITLDPTSPEGVREMVVRAFARAGPCERRYFRMREEGEQEEGAFSYAFQFVRGKYRNRICKRLFWAIGADVTTFNAQNVSAPHDVITEGLWKVILTCLPSLTTLYLAADSASTIHFGKVYLKFLTNRPKGLAVLHALYVTSRSALSDDLTPEEKTYPEQSYDGIRDIAQRLKDMGRPLPILASEDFWASWPGSKQSKEIARLVGRFMFDHSFGSRKQFKVYNHKAIKLAQRRGREHQRKIAIEYGWDPPEEPVEESSDDEPDDGDMEELLVDI